MFKKWWQKFKKITERPVSLYICVCESEGRIFNLSPFEPLLDEIGRNHFAFMAMESEKIMIETKACCQLTTLRSLHEARARQPEAQIICVVLTEVVKNEEERVAINVYCNGEVQKMLGHTDIELDMPLGKAMLDLLGEKSSGLLERD